jgi:hypothetical protein
MESQVFEHSIPPQHVIEEAMKVVDLATDGLNNRKFMKDSGHFPIDVLPKVFRDYIEQGVKAFATPPDYIALPLLNVVSVVLGNAYQIRFKNTWDKKPVQWSVIVGGSGTNKSAPLKFAISILKILQKENRKKYEEEQEQYKFKKMKYEYQLKVWEEAVYNENADLSSKPEEPEEPRYKQLIVQDATIETIPDLVKANPRGLIRYHDEIVGFISSMDKYKTRGDERQTWMQIKDGQDIDVNRKNKDVLTGEIPFVNILGTTQPERLPEIIGKNEGDKRDGFAQRFLYVWPDETYYEEDDNYEMDEEVIQKYEDVIRKIYHSHEGEEHNPIEMTFEKKARTLFSSFKSKCRNEMMQPDFPRVLESVWNKMRGDEALRMCIIIHAMRFFTGETDEIEHIDEITVKKVKTIIEYLMNQSRRVFTFLDSNEFEERIQRVCEHMKGKARQTEKGYIVTVNALNNGHVFGKETNSKMIKETLREMEKQGYGYMEEYKNPSNHKPTIFFTLFYA